MKTRGNKPTIFTLLLLIYSLLGHAQLRGKYWNRTQWTSETITFKSFHRFEYTFSGESVIKEGYGKYILRGDSLVLNFLGANVPPPPAVINGSSYPASETNSGGYLKSNFKVLIKDGENTYEPIPYANLKVLKNEVLIIGMVSNLDGECNFTVPQDNSMLTLEVSALGYITKKINVIASRNTQFVEINLRDGIKKEYYKKGDQIIFYFTKKRTSSALYISEYKPSYGYGYESYFMKISD